MCIDSACALSFHKKSEWQVDRQSLFRRVCWDKTWLKKIQAPNKCLWLKGVGWESSV